MEGWGSPYFMFLILCPSQNTEKCHENPPITVAERSKHELYSTLKYLDRGFEYHSKYGCL